MDEVDLARAVDLEAQVRVSPPLKVELEKGGSTEPVRVLELQDVLVRGSPHERHARGDQVSHVAVVVETGAGDQGHPVRNVKTILECGAQSVATLVANVDGRRGGDASAGGR